MLRVGPLTIGTLDDWAPSTGSTVSWRPSAVAHTKASQAPISDVPVSYMQAQHIRGYCEQKAKGLDYSRLMVVSCQQPGQCDIRAANYVINAHLRRHDTYRSWFQYNGNGQIIRRTIQDPADIEFVPVHHGELTLPQIREIVQNTPDPLQWGCFRFGIVQGCDHFTFFASVDHVHVDAMIVGVTLMEFHLMYAALVGGHALSSYRRQAATTTSAADNTRSAPPSRWSRPRFAPGRSSPKVLTVAFLIFHSHLVTHRNPVTRILSP